MSFSTWISGEWNITCASCNRKIKASEARRRWDGLIVCQDDYEERHPLDFLKNRPDKIAVPFSSGNPSDVFIAAFLLLEDNSSNFLLEVGTDTVLME